MTIQELERAIALYGREIYSFCLRLTGNKESADDLYQDTFLKATEKMEHIKSDGNLKSYLLSVAIRLWKNQKRKYAWRNRIAPIVELKEENGIDTGTGEDILQDYISEEQKDIVRKAVEMLPDKYKFPVLLHYMEDMIISEVAKVLKIPPGTVKSRLSAARKYLEKELEEYNHE